LRIARRRAWQGVKMSVLPKPKSKFKRCLVLALSGIFIMVFSIKAYGFFECVFYNKDLALTAWAVTQGVVNVLLSPSKMLSIFRA